MGSGGPGTAADDQRVHEAAYVAEKWKAALDQGFQNLVDEKSKEINTNNADYDAQPQFLYPEHKDGLRYQELGHGDGYVEPINAEANAAIATAQAATEQKRKDILAVKNIEADEKFANYTGPEVPKTLSSDTSDIPDEYVRIGASIASPSSENSAISSKLPAISSRDIPAANPPRNTLSRPDIDGLKPTPRASKVLSDP